MTLLPGIDPFPAEHAARVKASSAWYTPPETADALVSMCWAARPRSEWRILEPSAGHGALLDALKRDDAHSTAEVHAIELDERAATVLRERHPSAHVECCDYLTRPAPANPYDLCVMNSPYEKGADSAFLAKAMDESLRVVALVRLALLESQRSFDRVWSRIGSDEGWRLLALSPFISRPVFMPGGEDSDGGKTAFMIVKLSRVPVPDSERWRDGLTSVVWR